MTTMTLAGRASTNSRGSRPLPPNAVSARTIQTLGFDELVEFEYASGAVARQWLLSWVGGQWGSVFGNVAPRWATEILSGGQLPGAYGHGAEFDLAYELGEAVGEVFGGGELACRFYQDGGVALAAAARLARYATGRDDVASFGYHGAAAEWAHLPNIAGQVPEALLFHSQFDWGDVDRVRFFAKRCAAICVEVPALDDEQAISAFLRECRAACDAGGAIFILDEVVTGFRLALGGAAERYGVRPDIATYGKAMCATGCVSAIVGLRELVEPIAGKVFLSTTFGGAPGPVAVAASTVRRLRNNRSEWLGEGGMLHATGKALKDGLNALGVRCAGQPERSVLQFPSDAEWLAFCGRVIGEGVVLHRPQFPSVMHGEREVKKTLEAVERVLEGVQA